MRLTKNRERIRTFDEKPPKTFAQKLAILAIVLFITGFVGFIIIGQMMWGGGDTSDRVLFIITAICLASFYPVYRWYKHEEKLEEGSSERI